MPGEAAQWPAGMSNFEVLHFDLIFLRTKVQIAVAVDNDVFASISFDAATKSRV